MSARHYAIDRFEGTDLVVVEDDQARMLTVPRAWLPAGAKEGDMVNVALDDGQGGARLLRVEVDAVARQQRLTEAGQAREQLPRGPKGDVSL